MLRKESSTAPTRDTENRVEQELPRHEKIRFRRDEITDLATLPSAGTISRPARGRLPKRAGKILLGIAGGAAALVLLLFAAVYAIGLSGIGSERLRVAAEKALEQAAGMDIDASVGPARIAFDGVRFLALEVDDVGLKRAADGKPIAEAGTVRFGVRLLPLLSGDVRVSSASLSDARIMVDGLSTGKGPDLTAAFRNERGLIEPDLVAKAVFAFAHRALDAIGAQSLRRIGLDNVELVLPAGQGIATVRVIQSELIEAEGDGLALLSQLDIGGRAVELSAGATRDRSTHLISTLEVSASSEPDGTAPASGSRLGSTELKLSGSETGGEPQLDASMKLADSALDLGGNRGIVAGGVELAAHFAGGADSVEIERLRMSIGRSDLDFKGGLGPRPATGEAGDQPAYRFNLVSARSTIAPEGSPEPAMTTALQVAGNYLATEKILSLDDIMVKGGRGEALGTVSVRFAEGKAPGLSVAFNVHDMPVSQVKQLWPWFSARGARNWVLNNVFGGRVSDGQLQYRVEPGRLPPSQLPLTANESFGTFHIDDTRFDTAGLIPPVRDATGTVDYKGNDVDIALSAGTVYLPSGRTVAASHGTLAIRRANVPPVVGALDIDVAGEAPAVAELASYDPINAMRHTGLVADDFTGGEVTGNVKADIPLQKGVDRDRLNWLVALNYKDLSLGKAIDGQVVSDAEGTISVEKTQAVIAAKAKLNGVPAEIDAVEPLAASAIERKRLITLTLDDKARELVVPGLKGLVDGPVKVSVDAKGAERVIEADLTGAQVNIPWAGWSKGPGIAGNVSFMLENVDGKSTLSDFNLSGASFGIVGSVALSNGSLSQADFSRVRLNRNDDVAVTVKQTGKGYTVDVQGESLDARSLVRQFTADSGTATKAAEKSGSVSVNVDVKTVAGFHDEKLSDVKLEYRGSGDRVDRLEVDAVTGSGAKVELRNGAEGSGRAMRMTSIDAGAVLRFLDIYEHMEGGEIDLSLKGGAEGPMTGQVDARNFFLVNEPRLSSIVSTTPPGGDRSLNQAVKRDIDTSRVAFERCYSQIEKGPGYLSLSNGVLRGPLVGASFQGMLYDPKGNMDMTGTFMPAYGLNRIFGEIPIIGVLLGNGRDGGLIGVTFKLEGDADSPAVQINPLSAIAPGIFRSIFEFR